MPIAAADIMTRSVVTVTEQTSLVEVARLFLEYQITGVPVIDAEGRLAGLVSQTDLIRETHSIGAWAPFLVRHVMSRKVVTVSPLDPLLDVCRRMAQHRIHRVVVLDGEQICGILTSLDILEVVARGAQS
jgi:CBS domain-containing protein